MGNNNNNQWWKKTAIYQIYPRSFKDSNNDGIGDLQGITSKLDYLEWLGIKAIWLSPIYTSPMVDFGYDISDYVDIDPIFGNLEDFDELIKQAHVRNIKIIMDYVMNHSSDEHAWFKESRTSKDNPKSDWYIWRDPKPDGSPPNNWIAITGGSAWTYEDKRGQYFLHSFLPCQPDLNWRNPELKKAMFDVLGFWMDRGVDGFRVDMISWVMKDEQFRDDPLKEESEINEYTFVQDYERYDHIYSANRPERFTLLKAFRRFLDTYQEKVSIGEVNYFTPLTELVKYYGDVNSPLVDIPANFRFIFLPWKAKKIREFIDNFEGMLGDSFWPNYQLGNHDRPRVVTRIGKEQARVAAMLLFTLRGTPFIYNGEEIGMHNVEIPLELTQDPWKEPGLNRDSLRTPMQWDESENSGFTKGKPWLPIASDYQEINVEKERNDPKSFLNLYKNLLQIRKENLALAVGKYSIHKASNESCFLYKRTYNSTKLIIALNFSDKPQTINIENTTTKKIILSTYLDRIEEIGTNLNLRPNEGCIINYT